MAPPIWNSVVMTIAVRSGMPLSFITVGSQLFRKYRSSRFMKNITHNKSVTGPRPLLEQLRDDEAPSTACSSMPIDNVCRRARSRAQS